MFKRNTAVVGFGIGHFIGIADGIAVTIGTPTCKRTLDGTGGACANAASYNSDGAVWEIDLDATDMDAAVVILSFALAGCIPISYTIKTVTKLVSELVDAAAAPSAGDNATAAAAAILVTPANKLATGATGEASANVTLWKGIEPSALHSGLVQSYLVDKRMTGFVGVGAIAEAMFFDATMPASCIGTTSVPFTIDYDDQFKNWTLTIEDGNSTIMFATKIVGSSDAANTLTLQDAIPYPGFEHTDPIAFLLLPFVAPMVPESTRAALGMAAANLDTQLAAVAKTGADGDTLETLSDQIDGVATQSSMNIVKAVTDNLATALVLDGAVYQFTANALELAPTGGGGSGLTAQQTRDAMMLAPTAGAPAAGSVDAHLDDILEDTGTTLPASIAAISQIVDNNTTDATTAGSITRRRGDSWAIQLTVGSIVGYTSLWFTARGDRDAADTASVLQVKKNASGLSDGLLYVNAAVAATAGLGSITISNASTGAIIVTVDEAVTDDLSPAEIYYDVQVLNGGNVTTLDLGTLTITADVTRAIL